MNGRHIYRLSQLFLLRFSHTFAEALIAQTKNRDNVIKDCTNLNMFMSTKFRSHSFHLMNYFYHGKQAGDEYKASRMWLTSKAWDLLTIIGIWPSIWWWFFAIKKKRQREKHEGHRHQFSLVTGRISKSGFTPGGADPAGMLAVMRLSVSSCSNRSSIGKGSEWNDSKSW